MQGLTVWVFRHRGFPGRGQGGPETGVGMTKVGFFIIYFLVCLGVRVLGGVCI